ncbi:hypothetical protein ACRQ5B_11465 [Pseudarthrobacter sp. L19]|uniref:hypothetical protein n=1 Tax=Pseudarthrobacter sp. L19 TaxID=3423951 RepID=UPI003D78BDBF
MRLADAADADAWLAHAEAALLSPVSAPSPSLIASFDWKQRAAEYLAVVNSVRVS